MRKHSAEYSRYMKSEAWAIKRAERLSLDNDTCVMCGRKNGVLKDGRPVLQVHHVHYGNLGNEPMDDLCSVCTACHIKLHRYYQRARNWEDKKQKQTVIMGSPI